MVDDATVQALQRHWDEGWNAEDLDTIMEPLAVEIVFSSPFTATLSEDPDQDGITGKDALRSYIADALQRLPGIRYTLDNTYVGTNAVILAYTFYLPDGTVGQGSDIMRVNAQNQVVEWRCHYRAGSAP